MTTPLVSIGLPVYNGQDTILVSLQSLLDQSYRNIEIIICDDLSTDLSFLIVSKLASHDKRIRLIQNSSNKGAAFNFNAVLALANGKYFFWHAQDDFRYPHYVSKCVELMEAHPSAVFCHSRYIDSIDSTAVQTLRPSIIRSIEYLVSIKPVAIRFLLAYISSIGSTAFYGFFLRSALLRTPLWVNYIGSDISIFNSILLQGDILSLPEILFEYRARSTVRDKLKHATFLDPNNLCNWKTPRLTFFFHTLLLVTQSLISLKSKCILLTFLFIYEAYALLVRFFLFPIGLFSPFLSRSLRSFFLFQSSMPLTTGYSDH